VTAGGNLLEANTFIAGTLLSKSRQKQRLAAATVADTALPSYIAKNKQHVNAYLIRKQANNIPTCSSCAVITAQMHYDDENR